MPEESLNLLYIWTDIFEAGHRFPFDQLRWHRTLERIVKVVLPPQIIQVKVLRLIIQSPILVDAVAGYGTQPLLMQTGHLILILWIDSRI